MEHTYIIIVA